MVCQYGLSGLDTASLIGFISWPGSFSFSSGEKHPLPNLDWDPDPDKPGYLTSCRGDGTNPKFLSAFFLDFYLRSPTLTTNPRIKEFVIKSTPVEHPNTANHTDGFLKCMPVFYTMFVVNIFCKYMHLQWP